MHEVSLVYFKYKTHTKLSMNIPKRVSVPAVSLCIKYTDIFDMRGYAGKIGLNQSEVESIFTPDVLNSDAPLNISDIFQLTPGVNETIGFCCSRNRNNSYEVKVTHGPKCYEMFKTSKYYYLDFMCYKFDNIILHNVRFDYQSLSVSPQLSSFIYGFSLSEKVRQANLIKILAHDSNDSLPYNSLMIAQVMERGYNSTSEKAARSTFPTTFKVMEERSLPHPYDTKCFNYSTIGFDSRQDCHESCMKRATIKSIGKVPFSAIESSPVELQHISFVDVRDDVRNVSGMIKDMVERCSHICKSIDCFKRSLLTEAASESAESRMDFGIWMMIPKSPFVHVVLSPDMSFVEYLTFTMSTLSTWIGLSMFDFNPATLRLKLGSFLGDGRKRKRSGKEEVVVRQLVSRVMAYDLKNICQRIRKIEMVQEMYQDRLRLLMQHRFSYFPRFESRRY